jgi:hypothetical protein
VEIPLEDLFLWGTSDAPVDKIESAMNAGQDFVGDDLCDHYAFRQASSTGRSGSPPGANRCRARS